MKDPLLLATPWRNRILFAYFTALAVWFTLQSLDIADRAYHQKLSIARDGFSDYLQCYTIDKIICSDDRGKIYQPAVQHKWQDKIIHGYTIPYFFADNCPLTFLLMLPFTFLPPDAGHLLWDAVTLLFGAVGCVMLIRTVSTSKMLSVMILMAVAASAPSVLMLIWGQLSWFLLGTVSLFFWCLLKRKEALAGILLAMTAVKYQYMPVLVLALIPGRHYKAVFSMLATLLLLIAFMGSMWGWGNFVDYPKILQFVDAHFSGDRAFTSLRGLLAFFSVPKSLNLWINCVVLAWILIAIAVDASRRKFSSMDLRLWFAMLLCLSRAFAVHAFVDDAMIHGATAALFLPAYYEGQLSGRRATVCAWLLVLSPLLSWLSLFGALIGMVDSLTYWPFNIALASLFYSLLSKGDPETDFAGSNSEVVTQNGYAIGPKGAFGLKSERYIRTDYLQN